MNPARCEQRRWASTVRCFGRLGHDSRHWAWNGENLISWTDEECAAPAVPRQLDDYVRVFLDSPGAETAHLVSRQDPTRNALCGTSPRWRGPRWKGLTTFEARRALEMPMCRRCAAKVAGA